jgi:hypothetical protein
LKLANKLLAQA